MKLGVKLLLAFLVLALVSYGFLDLDGANSKNSSIIEKISDAGIILESFQYLKGSELGGLLGNGTEIKEENIAFLIINTENTKDSYERVDHYITAMGLIFKNNKSIDGVLVLREDSTLFSDKVLFIYSSREDFEARVEDGLEPLDIYNELRLFEVDKSNLITEEDIREIVYSRLISSGIPVDDVIITNGSLVKNSFSNITDVYLKNESRAVIVTFGEPNMTLSDDERLIQYVNSIYVTFNSDPSIDYALVVDIYTTYNRSHYLIYTSREIAADVDVENSDPEEVLNNFYLEEVYPE